MTKRILLFTPRRSAFLDALPGFSGVENAMGAKLSDHFFLVAGLALLRTIDTRFLWQTRPHFCRVRQNKNVCESTKRKALGKVILKMVAQTGL